jgi:hypothetical protein
MITDTTRLQPTVDDPHDRPPRDPPFPERLRATLAVSLACALVLGLALATVGATTAQEAPTVRVTDASVDPGETTTVRVVLTSAPDGLAGYELVLAVGDGETATVAGANYTGAFGLTSDPAVSDGGRTVRLEAADVGGNVEAGATDVTLATVELRGESAGRTPIEVRPVQIDADGGTRMNASGEAGAVVVGEPTATPTDESTVTAASDAATTDDATSAAATPEGEGAVAGTSTSGQGSLPLAGAGVAALAVALLAAMLVRRR